MKISTERPYLWLFAFLTIVGIAADQASKYLVFARLQPNDPTLVIIADLFELRASYTPFSDAGDQPLSFLRTLSGERIPHVNRGALFGIGNGDAESGGMNTVFAGISVLAAAFILVWASRPQVAQDRFLSLALGLILGGTLGNLYDRVIFGGVRDFLHCYYETHVWPDFNIADCCLVCGAAVLLVHSFFVAEKTSEPATLHATSSTNGGVIMKTIVWAIVGLFVLVFILTTFVPYPAARADALSAGFTEADIDIGLQFVFERRFFFWGYTALELGLLYALAMTGLGRRLADRFLALTGQRRIPAVLGMGLVYALLSEILYLPIGLGRFYHSKYWGLSNLELEGWLRDHFLSSGVSLVFAAILLVGFYTLLIVFPRRWWLIAPAGGSVVGMAYALLAPILINPLFNDFTPLSQTPWSGQQSRVKALIDRAEVPVQEILVMNASRQSNHTNAYFTGFGPTRRIVLYDTLLKKHTPEEVESVLAHELGHWQHDHIVKGILLGAVAALVGFFLLDRLLRAAMGRAPWHLQSLADPAGLPLILLLVTLGNWLAMPVGNAVMRYFERQADQASLDLAGQPDAFIAGERKMAIDNKSNVAPTPWNVWLFATHPPTVERIRMAEDWKRRH